MIAISMPRELMRRTPSLAVALLALAMGLLVSLALTARANAAEDDGGAGSGAGYLTLYPAGDVYQVQVIGDYLADGLKYGITEAFRGDPRLSVRPQLLEFPPLMRNDFAEDAKTLDEQLARDPPPIAVVMVGPQDRTSIRVGSKRLWIDSEEWRAEFARQIDVVMKSLKRRRIAVYWVSLPNVRRTEPNEDVQVLNEIIREKAVLNGFRYIDAYAGFADEGGGYSAMGPDLSGKIRLLREQNGVGFTEAGFRKLAHFVEREVKRDLAQAKRERTIPLAGTEAEQSAIAAARQADQAQRARQAVATSGGAAAPAATASANANTPPVGPQEQKADTGRISLSVPGQNGRDEIVSIDLIRPSIPATVIELVSKKDVAEKATTLGDLLIDKIPGGLIVMSSISPAADPAGAARSRLPPTQTPYFRVMVKGERMPVRAERADDVSWPRSEPPPIPDAPPPAPTAPPEAKPSATPPAAPGRKVPGAKRAEGESGVPATRVR